MYGESNIVPVQDTKSTQSVSYVQPVRLLKTTNHQISQHNKSNRYKKRVGLMSQLF